MSEGLKTTMNRIEIEREGEVAFLGYETDADGWISLLHTWVPPALRGRGIANELAQKALDYAKDHHLKVEVICPVVFHFLTKHPEYKPLVGIRGYR
jgi:predicted GNAT family acetyltransferase